MALIPIPKCKYCGLPIYTAKRKDTSFHKECKRKIDKVYNRLKYRRLKELKKNGIEETIDKS